MDTAQAMVLRNLTRDQVEVVALRAYDRLTFAEIARRLGKSVQAVIKLWGRGRDHLQFNGFEWDGTRFVQRAVA